MKNEQTINLLIATYQNAEMGKESIDYLLKIIKNAELLEEVTKHKATYDEICKKCELFSVEKRLKLNENSWLQKAKLWTEVKMSTFADKSVRNIVKMLMIGTLMGIIDCNTALADNPEAMEEVTTIAKELLTIEEKNMERLKPYLSMVVDKH